MVHALTLHQTQHSMVGASFCYPFDLPVEPILGELVLFVSVSLRAKTLEDAAWQPEQQSVKLKGSACWNDRQEKLRALMARSNPGSVVFDALIAQMVLQVVILFWSAGHYEA
jgi:hypothetical protein